MASEGGGKPATTQNVQYDGIGKRYNSMKSLPSAQPEMLSVLDALGDIHGARCLELACGTGHYTKLLHSLDASSVDGYDISGVMISAAQDAYPPSTYPTIKFAVADCSQPLPPSAPYDIVFAAWFLNYAGTERELANMFRVIEQNLAPSGRFIGVTTNAHDPRISESKADFYGMDCLVLDPEYVAPGTDDVIGVTVRVVAHTESPVQFDVFQLRKDVYERCAREAGLELRWRDPVLPDDARRDSGYWERWLDRPNFNILEAVRA